MKRWIVLFALLAALMAPAFAVSIAPDSLESVAAPLLEGLAISEGGQFSFNETFASGGQTACLVATGVYRALKRLPAGTVSFDDLSLSADGAVLVDPAANLDFRFSYLGGGTLRLSARIDGDALVCEAATEAEPLLPPETRVDAGKRRGVMAAASPDTVYIDCADDPDALNNASLAAMSLFDLTLARGDVFSLNAAVGPCLPEYGYVEAECGDGLRAPGGGVDRLAAALWLLVRNRADVTIIEKNTYGAAYAKAYVDSASDAIAVDGATGIDFSFRYTGEGTLTFYTRVEGSALYVALYAG